MTYDEIGIDLCTINLIKRIIENPEVNETNSRTYELICKIEKELEVLYKNKFSEIIDSNNS